MPYTRNPAWQNDPSTTTPITAEKLEHMEDGIVEGAQAASEVQSGNVELASAAEMSAGTDLTRPPSVKRVADFVASYVSTAIGGITGASAATESAAGIVELASAAEMTTGTDLTRPPSVKRVVDYIATTLAAALASKANVSGSISQFSDVENVPPANGDILRYDSGTAQYLALDPSTQFAGVGSDGRIVSSAQPQFYVPTLIINEGGTIPGSFPSGGIVFSRPSGGGGSIVPAVVGQTVGSNSATTAVTTTQALNVGDYLVISMAVSDEAGNSGTTATFAFSAGAAAQTVIASGITTGTVRAIMWQGRVTTAIPSGSVITITHPVYTARCLVILTAIPALVTASVVDVSLGGNGSSNATLAKTIGPTATTSLANEIAMQAWGYNCGNTATSNFRTYDSSSGWVGLGSVNTVVGTSDRGLSVGYKVLTATGTVTGNVQVTAADGASGAWAAVVAALKKA
jgi:hypothetical protein